jgi:organic radical activating enzyme
MNGGRYSNNQIIKIIKKLWPEDETSIPFIVFTGGEPLLQLKSELIELIHSIGFEIGLETNGTILAPSGINWVCVSPKAYSNFILKKGNELKVVFPQKGIDPLDFNDLEFEHFYIQPMDGKNQKNNIKESKKFIKKNPQWKLSLQTHKLLGIP